jgi:hypothetical protein
MKSEERHRLETNWMAKHLETWIDQLRPYASTIAGIIVALVVVMFAWSYLTGSSAAQRSEAWDAYNLAVEQPDMPDMEILRQSAEEYPGTKMQEMANVTWADGQVWMATQGYIFQRPAAMEALSRAASVYQGLLQSTDDETIRNRARLGMGRIYEMQDQLDKAREQYAAVTGAFAEMAKSRAEALAEPKTAEAIQWLASAEPPRRPAPLGPGTPGERPPFSAGDVPLPGGAPAGGAAGGAASGPNSFDALMEGLELDDLGTEKGASADRYDQPSTPPSDPPLVSPTPPTSIETPPADQPAGEAAPAPDSSPATSPPAAEQPAE